MWVVSIVTHLKIIFFKIFRVFVYLEIHKSHIRIIQLGIHRVQYYIWTSTFYYIYMNDICNATELLFSIRYADGTSVQLSGNDITYLESSLNVELELLVC